MSRTKVINEVSYLFNNQESFVTLKEWCDEVIRIVQSGLDAGSITAYEAHRLQHVGKL